jgi:4-hydroxy-3-polyprenylbenzoate decarboxylase
MEKLESLDELKSVDAPVHWDLEAAAMTAKFNETGGQAIHFKNIKSFDDGYSLAGGLYSGPGLLYPQKRKPWTKLAIGLELGEDISWEDFVSNVMEMMGTPIRPMQITTGTCKEVVRMGADVDVFELPVPRIHQHDGGRYGSLSTVIVRDPETEESHWGNYRWMAISKDTLAANFPVGSPIATIYAKYETKGESMPFAICIGSNPAMAFVSQYKAFCRVGSIDAIGMAGGLAREPLELVKAETSDLLVPADDEIIIEGEVPPGERVAEGPFPNLIRYEAESQQPVYKIKAITHRKNPVFPFSVDAARFSDSLTLTGLLHSIEITRLLRGIGVPVRWAFCPVEARLGMCVMATMVPYKGYLWQVSQYVFSWCNWFDRILFVDYELNPDEHIQMYNDMINKASPLKSWERTEIDAPVHFACKYPTPEGVTSRMYINATWDPGWPKEWLALKTTFEENFPKEIQQRVLEKWPRLGFKQEPEVISRPEF